MTSLTTQDSTGAGGGPEVVVVVPHEPGPLLRRDPAGGEGGAGGPDAGGPGRGARGRERDDLDELIDELFPDSDERPAWFDLGLVAVGAALVAWALAGGGPGWALVVGLGAMALGAILPVRSLWRRAVGARDDRRMRSLLAAGVALRTDDPATARLAQAYDSLAALGPWSSDPAQLAAHGAVMEAATLLDGRPVGSPAEREYVVARAAAIEDLVGALRANPRLGAGEGTGAPDPGLVLEARAELDRLTGGGALARLADLTTEARRGGHAPD